MAIGAVIIDVKSNTAQAQTQFQSLQKSASANFATIARNAERTAQRTRRAMAETANVSKVASSNAAAAAISASEKIGAAFDKTLIQISRQGMALGNTLTSIMTRDFTAPLASGLSKMPPLFAAASLGVATLAVSVGAAAVAVTRLGDEYGQNMAKIKNAVQDTGESSRAVYAELHTVAQNLAVPMAETVQSFSRIKTAINQLGGSALDAVKITQTLGMALQVSGATTAESAAAMQQFGQALASGVLQGDEFKSLSENASYLMVKLAKNLGVTTGELKKMGSEGKLTADVLAQAMHEMSEAIAADYANIPLTLEGALQKLSTSWDHYILNLFNATGETSALTSAVDVLAQSLDMVANVYGYLNDQQRNSTKESNTLEDAARSLAKGFLFVSDVVAGVAHVLTNTLSAAFKLVINLTETMRAGLNLLIFDTKQATASLRNAGAAWQGFKADVKSLFNYEYGKNSRAFDAAQKHAAAQKSKTGALSNFKTSTIPQEHLKSFLDKYQTKEQKQAAERLSLKNEFAAIRRRLDKKAPNYAENLKRLNAQEAAIFAEKFASAKSTGGGKRSASRRMPSRANSATAAISKTDQEINNLKSEIAALKNYGADFAKMSAKTQNLLKLKAQLKEQPSRANELKSKIAHAEKIKALDDELSAIKFIHSLQSKQQDAEKKRVQQQKLFNFELANEYKLIGKTGAARAVLTAKLKEEKAIFAEIAELKQEAEKSDNQHKKAAIFANIQKLESQSAARIAAAEHQAHAQNMLNLWRGIAENIRQNLTAALTQSVGQGGNFAKGVFSSLGESLKTGLLGFSVDLVFDPINHMGANFFKNLSGVSGGQNGGGLLSMLSQGFEGSSIGGAVKVFDGLKNLFDQGGAVHSMLGKFSANLSAANTFGANLAGSLGSLAGSFLSQKLFKGRGYANQGSSLGGSLGVMAGMAFGGPLGAALGSLGGSLLGGGLGSLFGDKKGPAGRSAAFGVNASERQKQDQREAGWALENEFGSFSTYADKWFSMADMREQMQTLVGALGNLDKAMISGLKMSAVDIEKAKGQLSTLEGRRYDFGTEHTDLLKSSAPLEIAKDRYGAILESMAAGWGEMITSFKGSFDALPAHIQQVINALKTFKETNAADIFGEKIHSITSFKPFQQAGESLAQTYTRLNDVFTITNKTAELTGKNVYTAFGKIGLASYDLRKQFIDLAGGMEKLAANLADYYDNYFSQEEQAAFIRRDIEKELNAVGLSMPNTRAQFRAMVESLNLNTTEGQKAHAALLNVAGAFAKITKASALDDLNERYNAQVDIFQKLAADATRYLHYAQRARAMQRGIIDLINENSTASEAWRKQRERDIWAMIPRVDIGQQLDFLDELSSLIVSRYQKEKELIKQIAESIKSISDFMKSLKLGDLSILTQGQKLNEALLNYDAARANLRADNSQSVSAWQQAADALLNIAKVYYSSGEEYKEIYRRINGDLDDYKALFDENLRSAENAANATRDNDLNRLKNTIEGIAKFAEDNFGKLAEQLSREYVVLQQIAQQLGKLNDVARLLSELPPELAALLKSQAGNAGNNENTPKPQTPPNGGALGEVKWVKIGEFNDALGHLNGTFKLESATDPNTKITIDYNYITGNISNIKPLYKGRDYVEEGHNYPHLQYMQQIAKNALERGQKEGAGSEFAELLKIIDQHYIDMITNFQPPNMPAYAWKGWDFQKDDSNYLVLKNFQDGRAYAQKYRYDSGSSRDVSIYHDGEDIYNYIGSYNLDNFGEKLEAWLKNNPNNHKAQAFANAFNADFIRKLKMFRPFARGTNLIPFDMPAVVHKGERIIPAADNRRLFEILDKPKRESQDMQALLNETKDLKNTVRELLSLLIESNEQSQAENARRIIRTIAAAEKSKDWAERSRFEFEAV